ncbi:DUF2125 domain-containing protein [Maricaulis sp. CAU 1757]
MSTQSRFIWPIGAIVFVLALYSAYWVYVSGRIEASANDWISSQRSAGYEIDHGRLRVSGYPYRFQLDVSDAAITAPATEGGWTARLARLRANAMPYDLKHWLVSLQGPLDLDNYLENGSRLRLEASDARFSLVQNSFGETERIGADVRDLSIVTLAGPQPTLSAVEQWLFNSVVEEDNRLHLRSAMRGATFSADTLSADVVGAFGQTATLVQIDIGVTEWASLARGGDMRAWSEAGGRLDVAGAELRWGPAQITGTGELTLDRMARPDGRLSLHVNDPDALASALVESSIVPHENEQALRLAAMLAPRGPEGVSLPFRIQQGGLYLGPVRLGDVEQPPGLR